MKCKKKIGKNAHDKFSEPKITSLMSCFGQSTVQVPQNSVYKYIKHRKKN